MHMIFGLVDYAVAGYLAWGGLKGRRRGLSVELPRLISMTLALVTGAGLTRWTGHALAEFDKLTGQIAGALGWGGCLVGAFYLARHLRAQMERWIMDHWPKETMDRRTGMVTGFLRTLVISTIVTLFFLHTPLAFLVRNSVMGGHARTIAPVYHIANRPSHP